MTTYAFFVWLHVIAAAVWVGSMVFFAAAIVPVIRRPEVRAAAPSLLRLVGARFRALGWISLVTLIVTGFVNLHYRAVGWSLLTDPAFWSRGFGRPLAWKLVLVVLVVIMTAAHDLLTGKRAVDALENRPESAQAIRVRRMASWFGRIVMLASLAILFFAVAMVRGFLG